MSNMFEQPLYEFEPTPAPQHEGDLFHDYELKGWISSPGLFKVIGVSSVAVIVSILVVAQTSLLTMKGCDSPLVGSVCQVLDTVYVGSLLFGTDREYVDAAYDKIDLEDSEITYIDVSKETPPLTYPAGYFQVANPEEMAMIEPDFGTGTNDLFTHGIPGIPNGMSITEPSTGESLFDTQPNIPRSNPNVNDETMPSMGNSNGGGSRNWPKRWKPGKGKRPPLESVNPVETPDGFPEPDPNAVAEKQSPAPSPTPTPPAVEPTGPVTDVELNKRPFVDLANLLNGFLDKKMVNLETPFLINATGKLDKNGKLERKSFTYTKRISSDQRMLEVINSAIEALNESGYLQYLSMLKGKDLTFEVFQDDQKVVAVVQSEFETDMRANTMSSLLSEYINGKIRAKQAPDASENDKDDLVLLQNAKVEHPGKTLKISFLIPKADLQRMIQKKLAEQRTQPQPVNTPGITKPPTEQAPK